MVPQQMIDNKHAMVFLTKIGSQGLIWLIYRGGYPFTVTGLFKNRKCQGTQHRLGWCSAMILPNLSHFYNVKKMVQGIWKIFCLVQAVMEGPKWPIFWDPAPFFLPYQNGSNLVESLLSTISSFAEIPGIFDFWKDQLVYNMDPALYYQGSICTCKTYCIFIIMK